MQAPAAGSVWSLAFLVPRLASLDPKHFPGLAHATVDARLLAFVTALFIVVVVLFSCVPVIEALRARDATAVDRAVGRSARSAHAGRLLAAAQIGLASIALVSTVLLVRTVFNLQQVPSGISAAGALTFRVTLPPRIAPLRTSQRSSNVRRVAWGTCTTWRPPGR